MVMWLDETRPATVQAGSCNAYSIAVEKTSRETSTPAAYLEIGQGDGHIKGV